MPSWWRRWRRRRLDSQPFPPEWELELKALPFYGSLRAEEQQRLRSLVRVFIAEKTWEGCGGLKLTDAMKVAVAAQACLLILNLDHAYYQFVRSILIYPSHYRRSYVDSSTHTIETETDRTLLGEASQKGPIVLAWDGAFQGGRDPSDGRNLVFHEFAHKLDTLDGYADATPPLPKREQYDAWRRVVTGEYEALVENVESGKATLLDSYGASDPGEFFAVATEVFFEKPREMRGQHAKLYELLESFYRQDPASRLPGTARVGGRPASV